MKGEKEALAWCLGVGKLLFLRLGLGRQGLG